jgi:integrase
MAYGHDLDKSEEDNMEACCYSWIQHHSRAFKIMRGFNGHRDPDYLEALRHLKSTVSLRGADWSKIHELEASELEDQYTAWRQTYKLNAPPVFQDPAVQRAFSQIHPLVGWLREFRLPQAVYDAAERRSAKSLIHRQSNAFTLTKSDAQMMMDAARKHLEGLEGCINDYRQARVPNRAWYALIYKAIAALQLATGRRPDEIINSRMVMTPDPENLHRAFVTGLSKKPGWDRTKNLIPLLLPASLAIKCLELVRTTHLPGKDRPVCSSETRKHWAKELFGGRLAQYNDIRALYAQLAFTHRGTSQFLVNSCLDFFTRGALAHSDQAPDHRGTYRAMVLED